MAFNAGTIFAKMKLDSTGFNTSVEATKTKLAGLRSAITSTSFLLNTVLAGSAVLAAKKLFELGEQGAKIKDLQISFEKLAASAGVNGNVVVAETKKITGALSDQQIVKAANMLEVLGVGMESLPKLTQIAASSARALGQDVGFMLESIATGTARQSRLWLDNLGIIIDMERAYDDYAKTLGKTARQLTDTEQRAAFLNAVLLQGNDIVGRLGTGTQSAAEGFASFSASISNLSDSFKVALGDMGPFMGGLARLVEWGNTHGIWFVDGKLTFNRPGAKQPYGSLPGIGPSMFQEAAAQMRAEAEAKAQQGRINAPVEAAGLRTPMGPLGGGILGAGTGSFLSEPGLTQSATALDFLSEKFFNLQDVALGFGDAIATAFHTLITDSKNAAKAFASAFLSSIGRIASNMGDLLISSAIGLTALGNPASWGIAIAMGFALKALGGVLSGLGQKTAPGGMTSAYAPPSRVESEAVGGTTIVIQGDFNGDPVWIDRLAEKLRLAGRDRNVKVVWEGA